MKIWIVCFEWHGPVGVFDTEQKALDYIKNSQDRDNLCVESWDIE